MYPRYDRIHQMSGGTCLFPTVHYDDGGTRVTIVRLDCPAPAGVLLIGEENGQAIAAVLCPAHAVATICQVGAGGSVRDHYQATGRLPASEPIFDPPLDGKGDRR